MSRDPTGRETDYTLDPTNGDVLTVRQVGQNGDPNLVTTYTYTPNPTAQGQTPGGLVATMTDPRGIETEYSYNSAGLVTSIVYATGTSDQASVPHTTTIQCAGPSSMSLVDSSTARRAMVRRRWSTRHRTGDGLIGRSRSPHRRQPPLGSECSQ